jgi:hypothetical protein
VDSQWRIAEGAEGEGAGGNHRAEGGEAVSAEATIKMLECQWRPGALSPAEWKRVAARTVWVRETVAAMREAQRQMDDRCTEAVGRLSEEEFERLCDEEQAKVDAFRAPLKAAAEHDLWPRELYFGCI